MANNGDHDHLPSASPRIRAQRAIRQAGKIPKRVGAPPRAPVSTLSGARADKMGGGLTRALTGCSVPARAQKRARRVRRRPSESGSRGAVELTACHMSLTTHADETLLRIAGSLSDAKSLLCFALACTRVGARTVSAGICARDPPGCRTFSRQHPAATEMWSLADEAARRWLRGRSEIEHDWTPRRGCESWMGLMSEVQHLRAPPSFSRVCRGIRVKAEAGGYVVIKKDTWADGHATRTAASTVVMRAGRHFVQFHLRDGIANAASTCVGVVRPSWNVEKGHNAQYTRGNCFVRCADGKAFPGFRDWPGMAMLSSTAGDRIGLLLDLDRGEMVVYKNGAPLGIMAAGLSGEYCWAVATAGTNSYIHYGILRLEGAPVPLPLGESLAPFRN